jgi:hypothetical protein
MSSRGWFDDDARDEDIFGSDEIPMKSSWDSDLVVDGPDFSSVKLLTDKVKDHLRGIDFRDGVERVKRTPLPVKITALVIIALIIAMLAIPRIWAIIDSRINPPESAISNYYTLLSEGRVAELLAMASDPSIIDFGSPFLTTEALALAQRNFTVESITFTESSSTQSSYGDENDGRPLEAIVQTNKGLGLFETVAVRGPSGWQIQDVTATIEVSTSLGNIFLNGLPVTNSALVFPGVYEISVDDQVGEIYVEVNGQLSSAQEVIVVTPGTDLQVFVWSRN